MDLNGDMELDNYEIALANVYEGANYNPKQNVTEAMAKEAIANAFGRNQSITRNVSLAIYDGLKDKIQEYGNAKGLGK